MRRALIWAGEATSIRYIHTNRKQEAEAGDRNLERRKEEKKNLKRSSSLSTRGNTHFFPMVESFRSFHLDHFRRSEICDVSTAFHIRRISTSVVQRSSVMKCTRARGNGNWCTLRLGDKGVKTSPHWFLESKRWAFCI